MFKLLHRAIQVVALFFACPVLALADVAQPSLVKADVDAWLDGFMPYALEQGDLAGAVVAVVKDGQVLTQRGYGYADVAARKPMDPERTLVRVGSVSKLFTWTALMQLIEQGKVKLDEDVNTYLDFTIPARDGKAVTVRDVMTHTPGFEDMFKNILTYDPAAVLSLEEYMKHWTPALIFEPGTMPAYSNYATALAGYIVQRVSGMPFDDYMDAHVLGPLAMTSSTFRQPLSPALQERMSKGYASGALPDRPFEIFSPAPAGSLSAPASDMAKFMIAHLQQGRFGESAILQPGTAREMHSTALTILPRVSRMVLGFYEANYKGRRVIAHGGDTQWFHSDLRLFIDDGVGLFVSMNSRGQGEVSLTLRSSLFEKFADRYLPVPGWKAGPGVDEATAREHARLAAGDYTNSRRMESSFMSLLNLAGGLEVIDYQDGTIGVSMVRGASDLPLRWREVEPFVWQLDGSHRLLSAEVKEGRVVRVAFDEFSPIMAFERPSEWKPSWLLPVFLAALIAMLVTVLAWPVSALARRYYGVQNTPAADATAHRWLRITLAATVVMWVAWAMTISTMMSDLANLSAKVDGWLRLLHALSIVVVLAGVVIGAWYVTGVIRSQRQWYAKGWSVLLALSLLASTWVAVSYNVITSGVNY